MEGHIFSNSGMYAVLPNFSHENDSQVFSNKSACFHELSTNPTISTVDTRRRKINWILYYDPTNPDKFEENWLTLPCVDYIEDLYQSNPENNITFTLGTNLHWTIHVKDFAATVQGFNDLNFKVARVVDGKIFKAHDSFYWQFLSTTSGNYVNYPRDINLILEESFKNKDLIHQLTPHRHINFRTFKEITPCEIGFYRHIRRIESNNSPLASINTDSTSFPFEKLNEQGIPLLDPTEFIFKKQNPVIGYGADSDVYIAHWKPYKIDVAMRVRKYNSKYYAGRISEASIWSTFNHQNIVGLYGVTTRLPSSPTNSEQIIDVCEYVHGKNLASIRSTVAAKTYLEKLQITHQIVSGVNYLHHVKHVAHADLQSFNILVSDTDFKVKICDFEMSHSIFARKFEHKFFWSSVAPELFGDNPEYKGIPSLEADIFALGVIIWEIFTGREPFLAPSGKLHTQKIAAGERLQISEPQDIKNILDQCWKADPKLRPNSFQILESINHLITTEKNYLSATNYEKLKFRQLNPQNIVHHLTQTNIGSGQFGEVTLARYNGALVAVKKIKLQNGQYNYSQTVVEEFIQEAQWIDTVGNHPNVVQLIGGVCEPTKGKLWLVTQYYQKSSLERFLSKATKGEFSNLYMRWASEIAAGMSHIHAAGVLHNDLALRNVLLTDDWSVKITDFGLACDTHKARIPGLQLPLRWVAPEVLNTSGTVSCNSDIWAFGITIWEMLTQEEPYSDYTNQEIQSRFKNIHQSPFYPNINGIPNNLGIFTTILLQCWNPIPTRRPKFTQIVDELQNHLFHIAPNDRQTSNNADVSRSVYVNILPV